MQRGLEQNILINLLILIRKKKKKNNKNNKNNNNITGDPKLLNRCVLM